MKISQDIKEMNDTLSEEAMKFPIINPFSNTMNKKKVNISNFEK